MNPSPSNPEQVTDFITGRSVPNIGAEMNRQRVERHLVEEKGCRPDEIIVDAPIQMEINGECYRSTIDLVVRIDKRPLVAIKCAAGSLGSREREAISAARLLDAFPLPLAVVSDGYTATVLDTRTGRKMGEGLAAIPTREALVALANTAPPPPLTPERLARERLIFRSYDSMNVNVQRRPD
ncbi:MAG TPA: type I restriction enzyme HsdR N-terminal domain-containing protein [Desulfosarcina sp.]|nr:type I restriction enzyme HsdR N-terminal domain-containing protein [Desulfosarcina sp.]